MLSILFKHYFFQMKCLKEAKQKELVNGALLGLVYLASKSQKEKEVNPGLLRTRDVINTPPPDEVCTVTRITPSTSAPSPSAPLVYNLSAITRDDSFISTDTNPLSEQSRFSCDQIQRSRIDVFKQNNHQPLKHMVSFQQAGVDYAMTCKCADSVPRLENNYLLYEDKLCMKSEEERCYQSNYLDNSRGPTSVNRRIRQTAPLPTSTDPYSRMMSSRDRRIPPRNSENNDYNLSYEDKLCMKSEEERCYQSNYLDNSRGPTSVDRRIRQTYEPCNDFYRSKVRAPLSTSTDPYSRMMCSRDRRIPPRYSENNDYNRMEYAMPRNSRQENLNDLEYANTMLQTFASRDDVEESHHFNQFLRKQYTDRTSLSLSEEYFSRQNHPTHAHMRQHSLFTKPALMLSQESEIYLPRKMDEVQFRRRRNDTSIPYERVLIPPGAYPPSQCYPQILHQPQRKKIMLRRKCAWKNYPELEKFLIDNREEYLKHSAKNYTAEQKLYNNKLTRELLEVATKHNYAFDPDDFDFVAVRDRIRCYYKSYVQSNKKRGVIVGYKAKGSKKKRRIEDK